MKDDETSWQYKPDGTAESPDLAQAVDKELKKPARGAKAGSVSWTASEYIDHKQGPGWFAALALITVAAAALTYVLTRDYFTIGVVVMVGVIVGLFARRTPRNLEYELSADGLRVGQKMYPYSLFRSFSIMPDGALLSLSLMPVKRFMPPLAAYFAPAEQEKIVAFLEDNLPYEERQLDTVEKLTRRLRF